MSKLAINGGKPVRNYYFKPKPFYEKEKIKNRINDLIDKEFLSGYRGSFGAGFWGGAFVRNLEMEFEKIHNSKALAVNSCTSALITACGAIGIGPGDEVIVTPWSMTCSITAPMFWGGIPVFADIEPEYFCLDPKSIEKKITDKTKAIIVVDLFGQPYNQKINKIAKKHGLYVIEDAAQAIGSKYKNKFAGTLGDIGCFSFTQGKHFTCGEGGMIVTNNEELYMKCALIRNHAEAVINSMPYYEKRKYSDVPNMYGMNLRMTETNAIILSGQLEHFEEEINRRIKNVKYILNGIKDILGITPAKIRKDCIHSYYCLAFHYDENLIGIKIKKFLDAVKAELQPDYYSNATPLNRGVPLWEGYITPIYDMPLFEHYNEYLSNVEEANNSIFITLLHGFDLSKIALDHIVDAFWKVYNNKEELI